MLKRALIIAFFVIPIFMAPAIYAAEVDVDIDLKIKMPSIPPPPLILPSPPILVPIANDGPEPFIYVAIEVSDDIVFRSGFWFRRINGHWYLARQYNAAWEYLPPGHLPPSIEKLPDNLKKEIKGQPIISYTNLERNWKQWDKERHWSKQKAKDRKDKDKKNREKAEKSKKGNAPDKDKGKSRWH